MISDSREALDEAILKVQAGRMSRRSFLERAALLGVSSTAAAALLAACGSTSSSTTAAAGPQAMQIMDAGGYVPQFAKDMIDAHNRANPSKVASLEYPPRDHDVVAGRRAALREAHTVRRPAQDC
jgi:hypothetical protein